VVQSQAGEDRRARIAEAAIEIVASRGVRALTHSAVDGHLALPKGSTSYYFRTRRALLEAPVRRITERSRRDVEAAGLGATGGTTPAGAARAVGWWLDQLLLQRGHHVRAR
jgi:AcrR family transcriptional regulator